MTTGPTQRHPDSQFAELLVRHDQELKRYIFSLIPSMVETEEILQKTAIALWERFSDYDPTRDFLPWATRFAYYEVLNFRKQQARSRLVFNEDALRLLAETRDEYQGVLDQRRAVLKTCLGKLSDVDRELLEQRYGSGSSIVELARDRDRTVKSLYRRLDRIRENIMRCVERNMNGSELTAGDLP